MMRPFVLISSFLLLLSGCQPNKSDNTENPYIPPSENEVKLILSSGELSLRSSQGINTISNGEIIPQDLVLYTETGNLAMLQDSQENLFLIQESTQISIKSNDLSISEIHLLSGEIYLTTKEEILLSSEEFTLLIPSESELSIMADHRKARINLIKGSCEILFSTIDYHTVFDWFSQQDPNIQDQWFKSQLRLESSQSYQWQYSEYRDLSLLLGEIIHLKEDIHSKLHQFLHLYQSVPLPLSHPIEEIHPYRSWFDLGSSLKSGNFCYRSISVEPENAIIQYQGIVGLGNLDLPLERNHDHQFQFSLRGYENQSKIILGRGNDVVKITLNPKSSQNYQIYVSPSEAKIYVNDLFAGMGQLAITQKPEEKLSFRFELEDYISQALHIEDIGEYSGEIRVDLKKSIQGNYYVSSWDPVGMVYQNGYFIVADRNGNLTSVRKEGGLRPWGEATSNYPNDWGAPISAFGKIYFSGRRVLSVYDPAIRETIGIHPLDYRSLHQYGRRVVPFGNSIALPTADSILLLSMDLSHTIRNIDIPGGTMMTPMVWGNHMYIASNDGRIFKINRNGEILSFTQSNAFSPMGMAMKELDGRGYFVDRNGMAVCFDLEDLSIIWEKAIPQNDRLIFRDVLLDQGILYIYAEGLLHRFHSLRGDYMGALEQTFLTPPWIERGLLYGVFQPGYLSIQDLSTAEILDQFELSGYPTSPVYSAEGMACIGMDNGRILIINQPDELLLQDNPSQ